MELGSQPQGFIFVPRLSPAGPSWSQFWMVLQAPRHGCGAVDGSRLHVAFCDISEV